jgi:hypothetical protein
VSYDDPTVKVEYEYFDGQTGRPLTHPRPKGSLPPPEGLARRFARRHGWRPVLGAGALLLGSLLGWVGAPEVPDAPDITGRRTAAHQHSIRIAQAATWAAAGAQIRRLVTPRALADAKQTQRAVVLVAQPIAALFARVSATQLSNTIAVRAAVEGLTGGADAEVFLALRDALRALEPATSDAELHLADFISADAVVRTKGAGLAALQTLASLADELQAEHSTS